MDLNRLVYASVARPALDYSTLTAILRSAEARNESDGITGILCFGNGYFLQALEGERTKINATYARIMADSRHERCELLAYGPIPFRRYADWSMKLVGLDDKATAQRRSLVLRHSTERLFEPLKMTGDQACHFLEGLALLEGNLL